MKVIFMGSPDFSVPTLRALVDAGHEIACVYAQPPRAAGRRGLAEVKTPVHQAAELLGLPVRTPLNFKAEEDRAAFAALKADVAVVVAYGLLLPEAILSGTRHGCFNGHASLLPRWRGAAPLQRAIMAGDSETGMMVMKMDKGLDTGPVALTEKVAITPDMTAGALHDRMMQVGARLMVKAMAALEAGTLQLCEQAAEGATYARKIDKGETRVDFSRPAEAVHNHVRGLSPFPGAWFETAFADGKPERVKLLETRLATGSGPAGTVIDAEAGIVACGTGAVALARLQKAGGKALDAEAFLRGHPLPKGTVLG
ncbi:methionyl-tRNA formyltransferase [Martelella sp. HB161492]|uniref:methionyl-tRNA formyltransferase n=1 Tax=Martelella sp. HB161492 TaxID=2720726 RepID=UPI001FED937D|nr:methionyl-tRNA formyltransferase [Martelella sp. HB161492]